MSDLQTDLNHWTDKLASAHGWDIDHDTMLAIIHVNEAARKYANPDIEAVANELVRLDVIVSPSVARDLARLLVDAALGVTEATHEA